MVLNPGKCHHLVLGNRSNSDTINLNRTKLASSSCEKLRGILIDRYLSFDKHIKSLCRKAGQKLDALARISNYLTHDQERLLLNSIIKCQFSYCPLIWMFRSRSLNNLINRIDECALRLIHNDHVSTFQDILEITKEKTIQHKQFKKTSLLNRDGLKVFIKANQEKNSNKGEIHKTWCLKNWGTTVNREAGKYPLVHIGS